MSIENNFNRIKNKKEILEEKRELAILFGKFYPKTINILIDNKINFDEKEEKIANLLEGFPVKIKTVFKKMYSEALKHFKKEKEKINSFKDDEEKIKFFLNRDINFTEKNDIKYFEIGAIPVLEIKDELYKKYFGGNSDGFVKKNDNDTRFVGIRELEEYKEKPEKKNKVLAHEIHHYIFSIFSQYDRKEGYADRSNEEKILETAFNSFKDEIMAYIIGGPHLALVDLSGLIYFDDSYENKDVKIVDVAQRAKAIISLTQEYIKVKKKDNNNDLDLKILLYPIMRAKNFGDLEKRILEIIPIGDLSKKFDVWDLFEFWSNFKYTDLVNSMIKKMFEFQSIKLEEKDIEQITDFLNEYPMQNKDNQKEFINFLNSLK